MSLHRIQKASNLKRLVEKLISRSKFFLDFSGGWDADLSDDQRALIDIEKNIANIERSMNAENRDAMSEKVSFWNKGRKNVVRSVDTVKSRLYNFDRHREKYR